MKKSLLFYKQLTKTEVGETGTHEVYVRFPTDFDLEEFFTEKETIERTVKVIKFKARNQQSKAESELRICHYINNPNKEKRMPGLTTLFRDNNVKEGDVFFLEHKIESTTDTYNYCFLSPSQQKNGNWVSTYYALYPTNFQQINVIHEESPKVQKYRQEIYYGTPGTGKSHAVKELTGEIDEDGIEHKNLPNVFRTTFHPESDYATFVGGYKPTMRPTGQTRKINGEEVEIEEIAYEFVPQAFTNAYTYAYNHPIEDTFLVIEEINRGNCAQIFGDLFQLLDRNNGISEYPIKADADLAKYLRKHLNEEGQKGISDDKLCLPANLHILATMNTSDQSLFPMDSAFKRRWNWKYVPIDYSDKVESYNFMIEIGAEKYRWVNFLKAVNKKIDDLTSSEDKKMGNFFIKSNIGSEEFKDKVMFYLWNEVCKDEYRVGSFFKDEKGNEFSFSELYEDGGDDLLHGFMKMLKVDPEKKTEEKSTESATNDTTEA